MLKSISHRKINNKHSPLKHHKALNKKTTLQFAILIGIINSVSKHPKGVDIKLQR